MPSFTPFYGIAYFNFNDRLDGINAKREIDRFVFIDKQIYGMYKIFGDGVVEGFNVFQNTDGQLSVTIESGTAIIGLLAVTLDLPEIIDNLPINETVGIYAMLVGNSQFDRTARYIWSRFSPGNNSILLASVTTGTTGIVSVDNNTKTLIGFREIIKQEIAKHKHRGTPSKIDLRTETKNQLPGARIEDFDASKIISGRFDEARIPQIDHNSLLNKGMATHAQLDSYAKNIDSTKRQLGAEIQAVNNMKNILANMYFNVNMSDYCVNSMYYIPGVSSSLFVDFDATTSNVNLDSYCISGIPSAEGRVTFVRWYNNASFNSYYSKSNISVIDDYVILSRGADSERVLEGFENVYASNVSIPGFSIDQEVVTDEASIVSDNSDTLKTEGFYSGKFSAKRTYRILFTKKISSLGDWSTYDQISLDTKSLTISHGAVYMYFVNVNSDGSETKSSEFVILNQDEVTSNADPSKNGFETRSFDIGTEIRDNVSKVVFYTEDTLSNFKFWIDDVRLRSNVLYAKSGWVKYRYSSSSAVKFGSINFVDQTLNGTEIRVRARVANSPSLLDRGTYSMYLSSGTPLDLDGTDIEIEVYFYSDSTRLYSPKLISMELQVISASTDSGFVIDTASEFSRGVLTNIQVEEFGDTNAASLSLLNSLSGNYYFAQKSFVSENNFNGSPFFGYSGYDLPISPNQAINYSSSGQRVGMDNPLSVYQNLDKSYVISDTFNDRIIQVGSDGKISYIIASNNVVTEDYFYPLCASYNQSTGILTINFSKSIDKTAVSKSNIKIVLTGSILVLGTDDEILSNNKTNRILEIYLSLDKRNILSTYSSSLYVQFSSGFSSVKFDQTTNSKLLYTAKGLPVYIGNITYIDGINSPIYAKKNISDNIYVCNSKIKYDPINSTSSSGTNTESVTAYVGEIFTKQIELDPPAGQSTLNIEANGSIFNRGASFTNLGQGGSSSISSILWTPTSNDIGSYPVTITATFSSGQSSQKLINITVKDRNNSTTSNGETLYNYSSFIEINQSTQDILFTYDNIKFSNYTLGSIYEIDENSIAIGGVYPISDPISTSTPTSQETFEQEAQRVMSAYRGKVVIINKQSKSVLFEYDSPDNIYVSDVVMSLNSDIVVAETCFISNNGRIIYLDEYGNITNQYGSGLFSKINDLRFLSDGNMLIST